MGPRAGLDRRGKISPPTGVRSPDRPARSQSLYRLSYPAHIKNASNLTISKVTKILHRTKKVPPQLQFMHWKMFLCVL